MSQTEIKSDIAAEIASASQETKGYYSDMSKYLIFGFYAFISSLVLGLLFSFLLLFNAPGISYFIFITLFLSNLFIPLLIWRGDERVYQFKSTSEVLALSLALLSLVFIYRLDTFILFLGFTVLPLTYIIVSMFVFNRDLRKSVSVLYLFFLPIHFLVGLVNGLIDLFRSFKGITAKKDSAVIKILFKILLGLIVATPVLIVFLILFIQADMFFAQKFIDFLKDILIEIFDSWETFFKFIFRLFVSFILAFVFAAFNLMLWLPKSMFHRFVEENKGAFGFKFKDNWDLIIVGVVMVSVNLLFLLFVIFQFVYLFGGEQNIVGDGADFTYSQYVRRGFIEIWLIGLGVILFLSVLNVKANIKSAVGKIFYTGNVGLLTLFSFVILISAFTRLSVLQDTYGYTVIRFWGYIVLVSNGLMLLVPLLTSFVHNKMKWGVIGITASLLFGVAFIMITPVDYIVASLNVSRFQKEDKDIDLMYLLSLSDEALPVTVRLAKSGDLSDSQTYVVNTALRDYLDEADAEDRNIGEFNIWHTYNKKIVRDYLETQPSDQDINEQVLKVVEDYTEMLENRDYKEAHEMYWSENTKYIQEDSYRSSTKIVNVKSIEVDEDTVFLYKQSGSKYSLAEESNWSGLRVTMKVDYRYANGSVECLTDSVRLILENGEWKIITSEKTPLGILDESLGRYEYWNYSTWSSYANDYSSCDYDYYY